MPRVYGIPQYPVYSPLAGIADLYKTYKGIQRQEEQDAYMKQKDAKLFDLKEKEFQRLLDHDAYMAQADEANRKARQEELAARLALDRERFLAERAYRQQQLDLIRRKAQADFDTQQEQKALAARLAELFLSPLPTQATATQTGHVGVPSVDTIKDYINAQGWKPLNPYTQLNRLSNGKAEPTFAGASSLGKVIIPMRK